MEIYKTIQKYRFEDDGEVNYSYEIYFLPMLRYINHGYNFKWIQFRWLIWGINFKINERH